MKVLGIIISVIVFFGIIYYYNKSPNISPALFNWDSSELPKNIRESIELYTSKFPDGAQIAMAVLDGSGIIQVGLKRESGQFNPLDNQNNYFEIGSITKTFTTALLLKLEADGILNRTDLLKDNLDIKLNPGDKDPNDIQFLHLANHTSGLPRLPGNLMKDAIVHSDNPYKKYTAQRLMDFMKDDLTLTASAGQKYAYSNLALGLLGHVLSKKMGIPYEELIESEVCHPLGLKNTSFNIKDESQLVKGLDGAGNTVSNWDFDVLAGCGGLKSTLSDMIIYTQATMRDSTYLSKGLISTFSIDEHQNIGLGWHIITKNNRNIYWHNGGTGGYTSCLTFDPVEKKAVITLTNVSALSQQGAQTDKMTFDILKQL